MNALDIVLLILVSVQLVCYNVIIILMAQIHTIYSDRQDELCEFSDLRRKWRAQRNRKLKTKD